MFIRRCILHFGAVTRMATRGTSVALPELFSDGDITLWLRKFELCSMANGWKEDDMLKRLPTLLAGKVFAVYERLPEEKKDGYKKLVEALSTAFGGDDMGKHQPRSQGFSVRTRRDTRKAWSGPVNFAF